MAPDRGWEVHASQQDGTLVLAGRFRCDRVLKRGRGVETWLAADLEDDGRPVVVKMVAADGVAPATRAHLEHEATVLRGLEGPSIQPLVASGREGHFEVFEPSMRTAAVERSGLRTDLTWAVERGELELHYQPVVDIARGG